MTSNDTLPSKDIVDLDQVLHSWASQRFGGDYVVEKIDSSKLNVQQKAVVYKGGGDWWKQQTVYEEYNDNDDKDPFTWHFSHCIKNFRSAATWSVLKAFRSTKVIPMAIALEYPIAPVGLHPLAVSFDTADLVPDPKTTDVASQWSTNRDIVVEPYSSMHACAQVRVCCLDEVAFTTEIRMSGSIKIIGHKRNRKFSKHEMVVGIADALTNQEHLGFQIVENNTDVQNPARYVIFTVEGVCTGTVGMDASVAAREINSLV